jgi:UDP-N-acetylglucosamine 2-epimerase
MSSDEQLDWMHQKMCEVIQEEKPDALIVYGDTNTTLAGAMAAHDNRVPLAHVEAGLRSYNNLMPEEYNRVKTDRLSRWLFCPTQTAVDNLSQESLVYTSMRTVSLSGDVMFDNLDYFGDKTNVQFVTSITGGAKYALLTLHRNFNVDEPNRLKQLISAVSSSLSPLNLKIVLPEHPRLTRLLNNQKGLEDIFDNDVFIRIPPASFSEALSLMKFSEFVMTDSGGIQKEAGMLGKKVLIMRTETEWVEWVNAGLAFVVDMDKEKIDEALKKKLPSRDSLPSYFFQKAAPGIVKTILTDLGA